MTEWGGVCVWWLNEAVCMMANWGCMVVGGV